MIFPSRHVHGFTLIELLIVLAISMTAVALVGGLSVDYMVKYNARAELSKFKGLLVKARDLAFISEQSISVQLSEHNLYLRRQDKVIETKSFEHIQFEPLSFSYSALGLPTAEQVRYSSRSHYYTMELADLNNAL